MAALLPYLKKKFIRNTIYAETDINGVFSSEELKGALHLTAELLATSWFENNNGSFLQHALPGAAQVSPVYGIVVNDFNKDGFPDILLSGNDSGFDVQTGPLDTSPGCLLLGDAKGGFYAVPAHRSGFWSVLESRGVLSVKQGVSDKYFYLIPNNDNDVLIFRQK